MLNDGVNFGDSLVGVSRVDQINDLSGYETIDGVGGNDVMAGFIQGLERSDLFGGDIVTLNTGPDFATVTGSGRVSGTSGADTVTGGGGADILIGHGGADTLNGGDGNDVLFGDGVSGHNAQFANVHDFAIIYQPNNITTGEPYTLATLTASNHDLLIINPARVIQAGPGVAPSETLWTPQQIAQIGANHVVLGYIDLAKINDFTSEWRSTWTDNGRITGNDTANTPAFLQARESTNVRLVDYTAAAWRDILHQRIDVLISQGFTGLFLDDALEYFNHPQGSIAASAVAMRDLIIDLASYARQQSGNPDFAIVVNGAPFIISDGGDFAGTSAEAQTFYGAIDGLLAESYFSDPSRDDAINIVLQRYGTHGVTLFSADRNLSGSAATNLLLRADQSGFIPTVVPRDVYDANPARFSSTLGDPAFGNDTLNGGVGDDILIGGRGADILNGGDGRDTASYANDRGGVFVNLTTGQGFNNAAQGDTYVSVENVVGTAFDDFIIGDNNANEFQGLAGNDTFIGSLGADRFDGGAGIDTVSYIDNQGPIFINLTSGLGYNNAAQGDSFIGIENITGGIYDDFIIGGAGANRLEGGDGNDYLIGALGADVLIGGNGVDTASYEDNQGPIFINLSTGLGYNNAAEGDTFSGIENIVGTIYNDFIIGGAGANRLEGRQGNDTLIGAEGADTFVFNTALGTTNVDTITDFAHGTDHIELSRSIFAALGLGTLTAAAFTTGAATNTAQHILYDPATGNLSYDADGSGAGAAIVFANLSSHPATITSADFIVAP